MLPRITGHYIDGVCTKGVGIVQIEFQKRITFQLPVAGVFTEASFVVACAPCHWGVVSNHHVAFTFRHVVTKIQVDTQFGQEVELVIKLCVADAAIDGRLVALRVEHRDGIGQTDIHGQSVHGVKIHEIAVAILRASHIDRLSRIVLRSQIHSTHVREAICGVDALRVQLNIQMFVKELWIEADGTRQTIHI